MAEKKQYVKYGLTAGAGLLALSALYFSMPAWREQQRESPHYRQSACGVCHAGEPAEGVLVAPSEVVLCQSCHAPETHGEIRVRNAEGNEITVDLGISHPFGIRADKAWPMTLPVTLGHITCQTCHDVHLTNNESNMLRLGNETDFTPLCLDCHVGY